MVNFDQILNSLNTVRKDTFQIGNESAHIHKQTQREKPDRFFRILSAGMLGIGLSAGASAAEPGFSLTGNIQTHGTAALYDDHSDDNLQNFFFRVNFGGKYTSDNFDGLVNLRLYPARFGTTVETENEKMARIDKVQADLFWGNYKWNFGETRLNLKLGHWKTDWSRAGNFGTYIDVPLATRGFLMRFYSHDAFEAGLKLGISQFQVSLGTTDSKFNTGYIRAEETLAITDKCNATVAYRTNAIDPIQNTAVLTHRAVARTSYTFAEHLGIYGEAAAIVTGRDSKLASAPNAVTSEYKQGSKYYPIFAGVEIPTRHLLNNLYAELEYIRNRNDFEPGADAFAWTVSLIRGLGKQTQAQLNLYSEKKLSDPALGVHITTTIQ